MDEGGVGLVLEELGVVAHEDVDVAGFDVLVRPDYGVVAHFDFAVGLISAFIDAGKDVDVGAGGFVPGVPLFVRYGEGRRDVMHDGVLWRFVVDGGGGEGGDVLRPADAAHELREPRPDGVAVEFA